MAEKQKLSKLDTIILSLHERWWKKMLAGEKILEIRKTAPTKKRPGIQGACICGKGWRCVR